MFDRKGNVMQDILIVFNCLIKFSLKRGGGLISENAIKLWNQWVISPSGKTHRILKYCEKRKRCKPKLDRMHLNENSGWWGDGVLPRRKI